MQQKHSFTLGLRGSGRWRPALLAISESEVWCPGILMFPRVVLPWTEGSYCLNTSRSDFPISCFNYRIRPCRDRQTSHGLLHGCTKSSKNIDQCPGNDSLFVPMHKEASASLSLICKKRRTSTLLWCHEEIMEWKRRYIEKWNFSAQMDYIFI